MSLCLPAQPERRFYFRLVVKTGFCHRDFGSTNEQQHHFKEGPISELHEEVASIQTTFHQYWNVVSVFQLW
jgi:hypothetical protein